ncbi:hypothetical protein, partial [Streptomyces exfoliatus]|uniref:hypothetical protein n=1 Tax=Streptomyces exfoliatus TaxID=1905 RepID=UPI001B80E4BB
MPGQPPFFVRDFFVRDFVLRGAPSYGTSSCGDFVVRAAGSARVAAAPAGLRVVEGEAERGHA